MIKDIKKPTGDEMFRFVFLIAASVFIIIVFTISYGLSELI
ncbi:MAG: hypothetical protein UT50_C0001G0043 [Candidatus Moranbacteria bacterium GW2011_GWA2_39_41]|nr:MAG: hypothetical protein UT50_C0001G0043 [Candidatus Moranbacteria bacterium GW2011_GWA2_39_41]